MYQGKSVSAIVLGAGNSSRMGLNINKVYLDTNRELIVQYSLAAFDRHPYIDDITLVVRREDLEYLQDLILREHFPQKPVWVVTGGAARSDSVANALERVSSDIVLIHDGARPVLQEQYITDCVEAMGRFCGAAVAVPAEDSLMEQDDNGYLRAFQQAGRLFQAQTPQCFRTNVLRDCHARIRDKSDITDDCQLLERAGYEVALLPGGKNNIKITTRTDIAMAEILLKAQDTR